MRIPQAVGTAAGVQMHSLSEMGALRHIGSREAVLLAACVFQSGALVLYLGYDRGNPIDDEVCGFEVASSLHSHPLSVSRHNATTRGQL